MGAMSTNPIVAAAFVACCVMAPPTYTQAQAQAQDEKAPVLSGETATAAPQACSGASGTGCVDADAPQPAHTLEFTFGSAQLFSRHSSRRGRVDEAVIPVASALLMGEWLFSDYLALAAGASLPVEEQAVLVDGKLEYEYAAPSLMLGLRATAVGFDAFWDSHVELQAAGFLGRTLGSVSGDTFFPLAAARVHIRTTDGFSLYMGGAYTFARDTAALIYGIGHRF